MKWFSQRKGISKVRTKVQVDSVDKALRNRLWNVLAKRHWKMMEDSYSDSIDFKIFIEKMWDEFFKAPIDSIPYYWDDIYSLLRAFFFKCEWFKVYDFLEFIVNTFPIEKINKGLIEECNRILEEEMSAYRFVGKQITQITAEEEITEIEQALETPFKTVGAHIETALELMSDRKSPDYRNSIKESISAVEAICRIITNDKKATLGQALDIIEKKGKVKLHKALKRAFDSLYGYTSSSEGIRHSLGLLEEPNLSFEDAKFMLVACSAFINYLTIKAEKAGLDLRT